MQPNKDHTIGPITDQKLINLRHIMLAQALRANKRKAKGRMRVGKARCCLCVAQDVAVKINGVEIPKECPILPAELVANWYGWTNINPVIDGPQGRKEAATYNDGNDSTELTHAEIADCFIKTYVK